MTFFMDIIKGMFIGIANVIPGVSGGTMAVSLGIYDKLIGAVSNLLRNTKKSVLTLLPIGLGCAAGIVGFTYAIEYLLSHHTYLTCMAFVGLIVGGLPILVRSLRREMLAKRRGTGLSGILAFLVLFSIAVFLPMAGSKEEVLRTFTADPATLLSLFLVGIVASATMVVPGVSGSLVMMILGYYYGVIDTIKRFLDALKALDMAGMADGFVLLAPFGIGVLLGIFLIAKLITFLFERYGIETYCAILGLIIASPFAIFYNTGLLGRLGELDGFTLIFGLLAAAAGAAITSFMGEHSS